MLPENSYLSEETAAPRAVLQPQHTYEDEVCYELSLQLAENLSEIGACKYLREVQTDGVVWLVTAVRL